jgi:hypothetical protein
MVASPGEYRWSSYRANVLGIADPLVRPHDLYRALATSPENVVRPGFWSLGMASVLLWVD